MERLGKANERQSQSAEFQIESHTLVSIITQFQITPEILLVLSNFKNPSTSQKNYFINTFINMFRKAASPIASERSYGARPDHIFGPVTHEHRESTNSRAVNSLSIRTTEAYSLTLHFSTFFESRHTAKYRIRLCEFQLSGQNRPK